MPSRLTGTICGALLGRNNPDNEWRLPSRYGSFDRAPRSAAAIPGDRRLSEGQIEYDTVEKTVGGQFRPRRIERKGPTGLVITTTKIRVHPENETRMLSIPITDSPEQTRSVLRATAAEAKEPVDYEMWHALQDWLAQQQAEVAIPFAAVLADVVPTSHIRLRRDFRLVLALIRAHALLQQVRRERDERGRIVAILEDYSAVRELVDDLLAEGLEVAVPDTVRETVDRVMEFRRKGHRSVSLAMLRKALALDKSTVSRRVKRAIQLGYLVNQQPKRGLPMELVEGEPVPSNQSVLPDPGLIGEAMGCCSVAAISGGKGSVASEGAQADLETFDV